MELDASLSLDDLGEGEFEGAFEADGNGVFGGDEYPIRLEADVLFELTSDKAEDQRVETLWSNCKLWVDDQSQEDECGVGDQWRWDGADELSYEDDECDMVLERQ